MINKKILFNSMILALILSSCSYNQTQVDKEHGKSFETAKRNQTLNIKYNEGDETPLATSKEMAPGYNALIQNKTIQNSSAGKLDNNFSSSQ